MNRPIKLHFLAFFLACLIASTQVLSAALDQASSTETMKVYQQDAERLTVYTQVPGHETRMMNGYASRAKSDIYEIWVRSAATDNEWVQCFANMTYNRGLEMPSVTGFSTATSKHAYQNHTHGWTHTYSNIEMSGNAPVEVEIRKIGSTLLDGEVGIVKSAVHPAHKVFAGSHELVNGRVYFKINNPCQIVIDINGQMDDHNAAYASTVEGGAMPNGSKVHSIALYANPIMAKPVASPENRMVEVSPNSDAETTRTTRLTAPDPATYDTLAFAPGVHNIGPNFKVHPGKSYYIPGDAILYGNIGNSGVEQGDFRSNGDRIKIYGYGTICGVQIPHYQNVTHDDTATGTPNPQYPEWNAWSGVKDQGVGIQMVNAWDVTITGVTTADPANFNTKFDGQLNRVNDQSLVSWVKLHSWRVNGDGFGGYSKVEDSFFRTSDDSTYVRDWRRRCTFWKDTNANIFRFVNYVSGGLEDCDILYARWRDYRGVGSVFEFASPDGAQPQVLEQNLLIKDIRFHDKLSNPSRLFDMAQVQTYKGLKFENISAYEPKNENKSRLLGSEFAPWFERLVFKNVTYKTSDQGAYEQGTLLTEANFNTYFETNEFVKYTLFDDPRNLTVNTTADPAKGVITKNPNQVTHVETTTVTLTADPKPGYVFTSWVGLNLDDPTSNSTANPMTIRMLENRDIMANFDLAAIADPVIINDPDSGSWTVPAGVYSATIQAWGGGGAGGSAYNGDTSGANTQARGGGAAGGGYASITLRVTPGQLIQYNNGAGGIGAASGFIHNSYGQAGGVSEVRLDGTMMVSALGGPGGRNVSAANAAISGSGGMAPTSGNTGSDVFYGGNGGGANSTGTGGGGGSAGSLGNGENAANAVAGAAGMGGGAIGGAGHNTTALGNAGGAPGAGGSGAGVRSSAYIHKTGGQGGDGQIIITYNTLPFPFTAWAGAGVNFADDANQDGVDNGMAWLLGATDKDENALNRLPVVSRNGANFRLTFRCLNFSKRGGAQLKIQTSDDLGVSDPWTDHEALVPDADGTVNGVVFDITDDGDFIHVIADIPAATSKLFTRIKGGAAN